MTRHQDLPPEHHEAFASATRLPAALVAPPPRDIRKPPMGQALAVALFIMPHTLVGVGTAGFALFSVARAVAGETVDARVVKSWETEHRNKNGSTSRTRHVVVTVPEDGRRREVELSLSERTMDVGDTLQLVHLGGLGHDERGNAVGLAVMMPLFAAFWNAIISVFWVAVVGRRFLARRLYQHGVAVMGRVTAIQRKKQVHVEFEYTPRGTGLPLRATAPLNKEGRDAARVGMPVPVLHALDRPQLCVAYGITDDAARGRPRST